MLDEFLLCLVEGECLLDILKILGNSIFYFIQKRKLVFLVGLLI